MALLWVLGLNCHHLPLIRGYRPWPTPSREPAHWVGQPRCSVRNQPRPRPARSVCPAFRAAPGEGRGRGRGDAVRLAGFWSRLFSMMSVP